MKPMNIRPNANFVGKSLLMLEQMGCSKVTWQGYRVRTDETANTRDHLICPPIGK
jgi:hypothetical protein